MRKLPLVALALSVLLLPFCGCAKRNSVENLKSATSRIPDKQDQLAAESAIISFGESGALAPYFANSYGCAVFPTIGKGGIGIGGAYGGGWVFKRGELSGKSSMTQLTIGFQWGGQAFSQIIFFENEAAYNNFTSGNFEFGAQASAVALTAGANAGASTAGGAAAGAGNAQSKSSYTNGMAIFTKAKGGLMYEASVGGQKFGFSKLP